MNQVEGRIIATAGKILLTTMLLLPQRASGQAMPLELAAGHRYATVNFVISKGITHTSKFGFFHQHTLTAAYEDGTQDDLAMQNLLYFEPLDGFRLTGGAFYGKPGFNATAGMQYVKGGRTFFILLSPRVNIESDPSFSVFSILRYNPAIAGTTKLYLSMQALNTFDTEQHIKSYQWLRVGLDVNGTQFGPAVNLDEFGPNPSVRFTLGAFVRRAIP